MDSHPCEEFVQRKFWKNLARNLTLETVRQSSIDCLRTDTKTGAMHDRPDGLKGVLALLQHTIPQQLGNLYGVQSRAFAQVVGNAPEVKAVFDG